MLDDTTIIDNFGLTEENAVKRSTLVTIRWFAVAGQTITVLALKYGMHFNIELSYTLPIILISVAFNANLSLQSHLHTRLSEAQALKHLLYDQASLGALLFMTGGLSNPFVILLLVPSSVSASILNRRRAYFFLGISLLISLVLSFSPLPLPWDGIPPSFDKVLLLGVWVALTFSTIFMTLYMMRVAREVRARDRALAATQRSLADEQKLSALGALAAATAHELGTPLGSILLIARDRLDRSKEGSTEHQDLSDLVHETERCRDILSRISRQDTGDEEHLKWQPMEAICREAAAPHEDRGIKVIYRSGDGQQPLIERRPELIQAMRNIIENAVGYAEDNVTVEIDVGQDDLEVTITDDGEGFSPEILKRIGEPYLTTRKPNPGKDGGMGLGVFIAKTLVERTGGTINFYTLKQGGAGVRLKWPRKLVEYKASED